MARLIVEAVGTGGTGASQGIAKPGNQDPLYIVISVIRGTGVPVTGLTQQDLQVDPIIVAPGGAGVTISIMGEPHPGAYLVDVIPVPGGTWKLGRYLFWLAVGSGADRGQTVFDVFVD